MVFFVFRLKSKISCKIHDEHYMIKDMPPPNEAVAKMVAKSSLSTKQGKNRVCTFDISCDYGS